MRGGLGLRRDYRLLADVADGMYYVEQTVAAFGARGREGGGAGAPRPRGGGAGRHRARGPAAGQGLRPLYRGDVLSLVGAGGGGFGAPSGAADLEGTSPSKEEP